MMDDKSFGNGRFLGIAIIAFALTGMVMGLSNWDNNGPVNAPAPAAPEDGHDSAEIYDIARAAPLSPDWMAFWCGWNDNICPEDFQAGPGGRTMVGGCTVPDPNCCGDGKFSTIDIDGGEPCDTTAPSDTWQDPSDRLRAQCNQGYYCSDDCQCLPFDYGGRFIPSYFVKNAESYDLQVAFQDESVLDPDLGIYQIQWTIGINEVLNCLGDTQDSLDAIGFPSRRTMSPGGLSEITSAAKPIKLAVAPDKVCIVNMVAEDPNGEQKAEATYILSPVEAVCPTCEVLEIPAILSPLSIYSADPGKARDSYDSASASVSSLAIKCGVDCMGNDRILNMKKEAQAYLSAATRYNDVCLSRAPDIATYCRISQYYSGKAKSISSEAMAYLCELYEVC
jgi:hypothetical protein